MGIPLQPILGVKLVGKFKFPGFVGIHSTVDFFSRLLDPSSNISLEDRELIFPVSSAVGRYAKTKSELDEYKAQLKSLCDARSNLVKGLEETRNAFI